MPPPKVIGNHFFAGRFPVAVGLDRVVRSMKIMPSKSRSEIIVANSGTGKTKLSSEGKNLPPALR